MLDWRGEIQATPLGRKIQVGDLRPCHAAETVGICGGIFNSLQCRLGRSNRHTLLLCAVVRPDRLVAVARLFRGGVRQSSLHVTIPASKHAGYNVWAVIHVEETKWQRSIQWIENVEGAAHADCDTLAANGGIRDHERRGRWMMCGTRPRSFERVLHGPALSHWRVRYEVGAYAC
jgi:hypothetical protein